MSSRQLVAAGLSATALFAATSLAGAASAHDAGAGDVRTARASVHAPSAKDACYTQDGADTGIGILSTDTRSPSSLSSAAAIDFQVAKKCKIKTVVATGTYSAGSGPADSATVTIYQARHGLPGKVVSSQKVTTGLSTPILTLSLKKPVTLGAGSYFLSVVASMDYNLRGGWFWELTQAQYGAVDLWENYGGGYRICPTWTPVNDCQGYGNDFIVTLSK